MSPNAIRDALRSYRANQARLSFLEGEAEELRRGISLENRPEVHAIHAQRYSGIPVRTPGGSITEKTALRAADGVENADAKRWRKELGSAEAEIQRLRCEMRMVDTWLSGLTEKERRVITAHELDDQSWLEMSLSDLLGCPMSESGLKKIGRKAIEKICMIAG